MNKHLMHASIVASRSIMEAVQLRPSQLDVLLLVWLNPSCTLADLCNEMPYDRTTVTKAAAYLRDTLGLIQDAPNHAYTLTEAGRHYCEAMDKLFYASV